MRGLQIDTLQIDDNNSQVFKLQEQLKLLGFYNLPASGLFDNNTAEAINNFKNIKGLDPDHIVNDECWKILFDYDLNPNIKLKDCWPNFSTNEIVNPFFDHCPAKTWEGLDKNIQENLSITMDILQAVRSFIGQKMRITSSYRPMSKGSAHALGKAIDSQFVNASDNNWINIMNWLRDEYKGDNFRAILEWNRNKPWLHLDSNFKPKGFYVMYPISSGNMAFKNYEGKLPYEYL